MTKDEMEVWFEYQYSKDFYKWEKLLSQDGKKEFETFLMEKSADEKPKNEESVYKSAKTKKRFWGIGIIASVLIASLLAGYVAMKKEDGKEIENSEIAVGSDESSATSESEVEEQSESVLPPQIVEKLKELAKSDKDESGLPNVELFYLTDENGNFKDLNALLDENSDLSNISENSISIEKSGETKRTRTRELSLRERKRKKSKRGTDENLTIEIEDTLQNLTDLKDSKLANINFDERKPKFTCRLYFPYGSSMDINESEVWREEYLLNVKTEEEKIGKFSSYLLGVNEMLSKIPKDKRNEARFILMGYADSTLFNGKIEISERSELFNTELSKKRAEAVKNILVDSDFRISPEKVETIGLGYSKNKNETTNLEKYRRVDVVVMY